MVPALILSLAVLSAFPGSPLLQVFQAAPLAGQPLPGEREIAALAAAWPGRVAETAVRGGEWMLRVEDTWFAWAQGRLLPEAERSRWAEFEPYLFYRYPLSLPPIAPLDPEAGRRLTRRLRDEQLSPPRRSQEFLGLLLRSASRAETEKHMVKMEVAGFTVTVHEELEAPLTLVSGELRDLRRSDPQTAAFLKALIEINGYNYRYVEGTRTRSYHSYGIAIDLIPRSYGRKETYWMWAANRTSTWWEIPYERRWMVPEKVLRSFERHGFVWGGKWLLFDTMHFDYRPEVLLMAHQAPGEG
jgi:hypothetical protein